MPMSLENAVRTEIRFDGSQRRTMGLFLCSGCGKEIWTEVTPKHLSQRSGKCRRCSAIGLGRKRPYEWLYNDLVYNAHYFQREITITFENFLEFTKASECHYCSSPVAWAPHNSGNVSTASNLDRKDSGKGYIPGNLVVACAICNRIKNSHLSYEEMLRLGPVLRDIMEARKNS